MSVSWRGITHAGERWQTVRLEAILAISGTICAVVAPGLLVRGMTRDRYCEGENEAKRRNRIGKDIPVPMMATRLPSI